MSLSTEALVLVSYGAHGVVQTDDGQRLDCKFRRKVGRPWCGDRVRIIQADADTWMVEEIFPRRNRFLRGDPKGRKHAVAANLDRVLVIIASRPLPSQDLLDRYLVAVHSLDIEPVIVHNKVELPFDATEAGAATLGRLEEYRQLGYTVIRTSCKGEPGVAELAQAAAEGTSILVGQSGVGKSSLARLLLPDIDIQVGDLSRATGKGTHTTTTTMLYQLPGGGRLIDSPGVWEYGLWTLENQEISHGFREFSEPSQSCRFNDCLHRSEPNCGVKEALEAGKIQAWRYQSYLRLLTQNQAR
jgi:ribosome biogenesis GTPase